MKFEKALEAMREGKTVTAPSVTDNQWRLSGEMFVVFDGMHNFPTYGIKIGHILAEDWEIVDDRD